MNVTELTQLVNGVGFPIAAFIAVFWYMVKIQAENTEVIANNTKVLAMILEHIKGAESDGR